MAAAALTLLQLIILLDEVIRVFRLQHCSCRLLVAVLAQVLL